jgi:hypothetical protein
MGTPYALYVICLFSVWGATIRWGVPKISINATNCKKVKISLVCANRKQKQVLPNMKGEAIIVQLIQVFYKQAHPGFPWKAISGPKNTS